MRIFILMSALILSPLLVCGAAHAKPTGDIGKPVCSRYDDASKSKDASASADQDSDDTGTPATATMASAPATPPVKVGGTASALHQHSSLRWQAFLPGMFR
ncbi:MAG TPA: hypothetical protein VGH80_05865 [Xanthomonadaceae bacterium]